MQTLLYVYLGVSLRLVISSASILEFSFFIVEGREMRVTERGACCSLLAWDLLILIKFFLKAVRTRVWDMIYRQQAASSSLFVTFIFFQSILIRSKGLRSHFSVAEREDIMEEDDRDSCGDSVKSRLVSSPFKETHLKRTEEKADSQG